MRNILVIFGGLSTEHDVSIISGVQAINNMRDIDGKVYPIYIDKDNTMWYSSEYANISTFANGCKATRVAIIGRALYKLWGKVFKKICDIDSAVLALHGGLGEGGGVQGLLSMCGIPYTSSGVLGSALAMDKAICKDVLLSHKIPVVPYVTIHLDDYYENKSNYLSKLARLGYPIILKPTNGGSSIGITTIHSEDDLEEGLAQVFTFSDYVIAEKYLEDIVELNMAAFRDGDQIVTSNVEQVSKSEDILSFSDKYLGDTHSMDSLSRVINPRDYSTQIETIRKLTLKIYNILHLDGVCRIDYIVSCGKVYFNEVNTIPGSLANYLFEMDYCTLLEKLIHNSKVQEEKDKRLVKCFPTYILSKYSDGKKLSK